MNELLISAGFGILGAVVRVLIVSLQIAQLRKNVMASGFMLYALVVVAIGAFSGIVLSYGKVLSFLAGYAGLDLIEGYYKVFSKKKVGVR